MIKHPTVAILASGEGTTTEAIIRAGQKGEISTRIGLVISNNPKAGVFKRIERLNQEFGLSIACKLIGKSTHPATKDEKLSAGSQSAAEESAILETLQKGNFDLILLLGYMKKVGPRLVRAFGWRSDYTSPYQVRMLNSHAGLFPDTKGYYGIHKEEHVIKEHFPFSGYTLHTVAEDYDDGPTIAEHRHPVLPDDTPETLHERDQAIEKKFLPGDVAKFIESRTQYLKDKA